MVFPAPYPEDDSMVQWAKVAGYVHPEPVDTTNFDFESFDALFDWGQGGTLPEPQLGGEPGLDWATLPAGDVPTPDYLAAAPAAATAPAPVPSPLPATINFEDLLDLEWDATFPLTPALTDVSSTTSPQSDGTGGQPFPFPTYEAAASQFPPAAALPDFNLTDILQSEQPAIPHPSWLIGDGLDLTGQAQYISTYNLMSMYGNTHIEANLDEAMPIDAPSTTTTTNTECVGVSEKVLGKRRRESGCELPQKRGRTTTAGVLEAAGSTKRARPMPATKTQQRINNKSKVVGRGVGRLASTTARGVYRQSLLGHSVLQGSVVALAQGQPSWTEEREQEETRHDTQEPEIAEDMEPIPEKMTAWQRSLLEITSADVERGAVRTIKCRLCPGERFKTWACFGRHCRDCEEHPEKIKCCDRCGIYFGRQDSMKRHRNSGTKACCATTPAEAAWRKHRAEQLLTDFQKRVEGCLRTGEELGPKFAAIARAELPSSSKKFLSKRTKSGGDNSQD